MGGSVPSEGATTYNCDGWGGWQSITIYPHLSSFLFISLHLSLSLLFTLLYLAIYYHLSPSMGGSVLSEGATTFIPRWLGRVAIYYHLSRFLAIYRHLSSYLHYFFLIYCHFLLTIAIYGRPCTFGGGHHIYTAMAGAGSYLFMPSIIIYYYLSPFIAISSLFLHHLLPFLHHLLPSMGGSVLSEGATLYTAMAGAGCYLFLPSILLSVRSSCSFFLSFLFLPILNSYSYSYSLFFFSILSFYSYFLFMPSISPSIIIYLLSMGGSEPLEGVTKYTAMAGAGCHLSYHLHAIYHHLLIIFCYLLTIFCYLWEVPTLGRAPPYIPRWLGRVAIYSCHLFTHAYHLLTIFRYLLHISCNLGRLHTFRREPPYTALVGAACHLSYHL
jgi:hypothetical protein